MTLIQHTIGLNVADEDLKEVRTSTEFKENMH